jgi:hypothetical protein
VNVSNARIGYEPQRGDGALCISFKDKQEAIFFAEAILQEVQNIENDGLSVSECALITISFGPDGNPDGKQEPFQSLRQAFPGQRHNVLVTVPDRN